MLYNRQGSEARRDEPTAGGGLHAETLIDHFEEGLFQAQVGNGIEPVPFPAGIVAEIVAGLP